MSKFGPHKSGRPMTVRERALAESVFGSALDCHSIRIHNRKYWWFQPRHVTMAPNGHLWFHPKGDLFCADFCDRDLSLQGHFIHELGMCGNTKKAYACRCGGTRSVAMITA